MSLSKKSYYYNCHRNIVTKFYVKILVLIIILLSFLIFPLVISLPILLIYLYCYYGYLVEAYFYLKNPYFKHLSNKY